MSSSSKHPAAAASALRNPFASFVVLRAVVVKHADSKEHEKPKKARYRATRYALISLGSQCGW